MGVQGVEDEGRAGSGRTRQRNPPGTCPRRRGREAPVVVEVVLVTEAEMLRKSQK